MNDGHDRYSPEFLRWIKVIARKLGQAYYGKIVLHVVGGRIKQVNFDETVRAEDLDTQKTA